MIDELRRILPKVLLFLAIALAIDQGMGRLLDAAQARLRAGYDAVPGRALAARAEVVVLGSSRAHRHVDPIVLGDALGASVYNAGCPGQSLPYMRGVEDLLLQHYTPRAFLIHLDPQMLVDLERFGRVARLAPFMRESDVVSEMIYERGRWERLKYLLDSYRYNDRLLDLLLGLATNEDPTVQGYLPREGEPGLRVLNEVMWPRSFALVEERLSDEPDPRRVALLREIVTAARERGATPILLTSPRWRPGPEDDPRRAHLMREIAGIAREEEVPFLEITIDDPPVFRDPDLFADTQHLNRQGAELFSRVLARRIAEGGLLGAAPGSDRP